MEGHNLYKLDKFLYEQELSKERWLHLNLIDLSYFIADKPFSKTPLINLKNEIIEQLHESNFLLETKEEDYFSSKKEEWLYEFIKQYKPNEGRIDITIVPTLSCNFRCSYCYQPEAKEYETRTEKKYIDYLILDKLFSFLESDIQLSDRSIKIGFCGGEVFLDRVEAYELIEYIVRKMDDFPINQLSFTTNGYNIDLFLPYLKSIESVKYNITIDGLKEIHNSRRYLAGSRNTFNKIITNIELLLRETNHEVLIRINLDSQNLHAINDFLEFLKKKGILDSKKVFILFRNVTSYLHDENYKYPISVPVIENQAMLISEIMNLSRKFDLKGLHTEFIPQALQKIFDNEIKGNETKTITPINLGCIHNQDCFGTIDYNVLCNFLFVSFFSSSIV